MPTISSSVLSTYANQEVSSTRSAPAAAADSNAAASAQGVSTARADVTISSLSSRLSKAEQSSAAASGLPRDQLREKAQANIDKVSYPLTEQNKARMAKEVPQPADAGSLASAAAANALVDDLTGPNPFAGLSREQLSTIVNDDSGTFTTNERYAACRQAYDDEQKWRTRVVAQAMEEYNRSGKMTNFFESVLAHYNALPAMEQALYPDNYAADLKEKIDLDFNYFTHMPHGLPGKAPGSVADLQSMLWGER